ncbi:MAG: T9SS type A sorting domain-containing protein, partial [Ferruginibacter sp.]
ICASTNGMTGSTLMPGSLGGANSTSFGTINGSTCGWNNANNNDVWIAYTATSDYVCLSISGIDQNLQSIVVTDANQDGDNNPCTGTAPSGGNDPRWIVASCPNNAIYSGTSGTSYNQQHCFNTIQGKTYYLVVDGNGGANSPFYIYGNNNINIIPVKFIDFYGLSNEKGNLLKWTAVNEKADSLFVEKSQDAISFQSIGAFKVKDNSSIHSDAYQFTDRTPYKGNNFYRIKAVDADGAFLYSKTIALNNTKVIRSLSYFPNPINNALTIQASISMKQIRIVDAYGRPIYETTVSGFQKTIPTHLWNKGIYGVSVIFNNQKVESFSVVK